MSIIKLLNEFTTDNLTKKLSSRREVFSTFNSVGKKAALAAVPFGLGSLANTANAAPMFQQNNIVGALQLALKLEYLEAEFYMKALNSGILAQDASGKSERIYAQISKHEDAHVTLLQGALGDNSIDSPTFDFTVGGAFDPFGENTDDAAMSYQQLLILAQAFEDTGVRAYKGQAGNLMSDGATLTIGLQIHSVEARHASEIRRLRGLKGWITGDNPQTGVDATNAVYAGEDNVTHAGVDVTTLGSGSPFTADAASEAYDETLSGSDAETIASLFIQS